MAEIRVRCLAATFFISFAALAVHTKSGIEVYFNHNVSTQYSDPYRNITRSGDNFEEILLSEIQKANKEISVAVQELRLPRVSEALIAKQRAGVKVRVVVEDSYNQEMEYLTLRDVLEIEDPRARDKVREYFTFIDLNNDQRLSPDELLKRDSVYMMRKNQIPLIDDANDSSEGTGLMHHKFVIFDRKRVLVTSANFTMSDFHGDFSVPATRGNANAMVILQGDQVARSFVREFDLLWGGGPHSSSSRFGLKKPFRGAEFARLPSGTDITIQFSPASRSTRQVPWEWTTNGLIAKTIEEAKREVSLALFVFSDQVISNTLENVHARGTEVKALIDPNFAYLWYSELLDMLGLRDFDSECHVERGNQVWRTPIQSGGVPRLVRGDKLHHKFAVVDGSKVIFGSHNWSASANHQNDENLLIIDDAEVAQLFTQEFSRLYQESYLGTPSWLENRVRENERNCTRGGGYGLEEGSEEEEEYDLRAQHSHPRRIGKP